MIRFPACNSLRRPHQERDGMALVIVLSVLVLLSALVIAFFVSVTTDRTAAESYSQSGDARKLADSALNLVVAQIKDSTNGADATGAPIPWASQPGLIRTFNVDGTTNTAFKLYSDSDLRDSTGTYDPAVTDFPPADWYTAPALYTDINAPVAVPDLSGGANVVLDYPVADPAALAGNGTMNVKGFSIDNAPVQPGTGVTNQLPMPVQWLYLLQDGRIVGASGTGADATLIGAPASADNPIVGRIAFWTDDDTCKVNINTAAGDLWNDTANPGTFSDMPYSRSSFEGMFRDNQPIQKEYQRYPGHPATTYLSAVFPDVLNTRNRIMDVAPKITNHLVGNSTDISSIGGTVKTNIVPTPSSQKPLPFSDGDHLYTNIDELQFVNLQQQLGDKTRPVGIFTPQQVKQAGFFLTAQSRAPDLNLYGKPRISMWPQTVNASGTLLGTPFDKTIAFCSTIGAGAGAYKYYFVRKDPRSATYDYKNFPRNQQLYRYLQDLTGDRGEMPGFGGSFKTKYGTDRDQILTEMFDYIRSCINLVDTTGSAPYAGMIQLDSQARFMAPGTGQVIPIEIGNTRGFGRVFVPSNPILHIVALNTQVDPAFLAVNDKNGDKVLIGNTEKAAQAKLYTNKLQAAVLVESFCASMGVPRIVPDLIYEFEGLNSFTLHGSNLGFPAKCEVGFRSYTPNHEYGVGGTAGPANLFYSSPYTARSVGMGTDNYQFIGQPISFPLNTVEIRQPLEFKGGDVTLKVYARDSAGNKVPAPIQSITFTYPDTYVPCPAVDGCYRENYDGAAKSPIVESKPNFLKGESDNRTYLSGRSTDSPGPIAPNYRSRDWVSRMLWDVTRGLVPYHGDMRLVAAQTNVDTDAKSQKIFGPARAYQQTVSSIVRTYNHKAGLYNDTTFAPVREEATGGMHAGTSARTSNRAGNYVALGNLLTSDSYYDVFRYNESGSGATNHAPAVPSIIDGTPGHSATLTSTANLQEPGDWDTGMASLPDGPYINKADEGDRGPGAYGSHDSRLVNPSLFSPNRQVPSPVVFGSLSTGVKRALPWQTLLFCPNPAAKDKHPGFQKAKDHLLLDLFTMPVVEPYAISEPFSTAGKINMNYQIAPFPYITRSTGLQAVLRSTMISAIPTADSFQYKTGSPAPNPSAQYRRQVDIDATLKGFEERFAANKPFRSASEICEMFLVPQGVAVPSGSVETQMREWWNDYGLTGDNLREKPYNYIYSRLTTKSNIYTTHIRVQALRKRRGTPDNTWVEGKDLVVSEYRGSFTIERYIDPNDAELLKAFDENHFEADQIDGSGRVVKTGRLEPFYRYRIVSSKQFSP